MDPLIIGSASYIDKVNGCWMGKNCGGTLGGPLEKGYGEEEPFDVWWYPKLEPGGIANDDLEMQLIWLKCLEEVGPGMLAKDLVTYWLDHINYNWDEYGFSKTNMRHGLMPPVCSSHNNWFKDCMGCPIRSELWACVAPGVPRIAVRYAYEDAITDHAGGESVWGEFFNTAVESAAFVEKDSAKLIDIGLSYMPEGTMTRAAIEAAVAARKAGVDWKEGRRRVIKAAPAPSLNAQHSPVNIGFQVVGWLWGDDFGDAICKAVNCGYDTDCTGATVGSFLGIVLGRSGLPLKWTEPLGENIATSEPWGSLLDVSTGPNPIPKDIPELTRRTVEAAKSVLSWHRKLDDHGAVITDAASLYADEEVYRLAKQSPTRVIFSTSELSIGIEYGKTGPAIIPGQSKSIQTHLRNPHPRAIKVTCNLIVPAGWTAPTAQATEIPGRGEDVLNWTLAVPGFVHVRDANQLMLNTVVDQRPAVAGTPIVLLGAYRYRASELFPANGRSDQELIDTAFDSEAVKNDVNTPAGRPGKWRELLASENPIPGADLIDQDGVLYVQTFINCPDDRPVRIAVPSNYPVKVWLNNSVIGQVIRYGPIRPNYGGGADQLYLDEIPLRKGWNEVLMKFVRTPKCKGPLDAHFILCSNRDARYAGLVDVGRTLFPWE